MADRPFLTATLIGKNERANVRRCLDSIWAWCDEIVYVDTGSTDGTVAELKRYAKGRGETRKLKTARFTDCNDESGLIRDFAAARQAADDLATGEWLIWCDLDDTVTGLAELRRQAQAAPADVIAFFCRYRYADDDDGNPISELWRERLVRNDGTKWTGRLHEHKLIAGGTVVKVDPRAAEWVHHRDHNQRTGDRNLRILEQWNVDEPDQPRILQALALEYMGSERPKDASDMFARFLELPGEDPDRRAQASRQMSVMLMLQGRVEEARAAALRSLGETWLWADTHLTLAEVEQTLGRPHVGLTHAETALRIGQPDTLLIVNPLQYTVHPRALMAVCLAQMGRFEEAVKVAEEGLAIAPSYQLINAHLPLWRGMLKKQRARDAFLACADVLVETGELLKAQALMNAAPWFVADDARIVSRRGELFRLVSERRGEGSALAEDQAADLFVARHREAA